MDDRSWKPEARSWSREDGRPKTFLHLTKENKKTSEVKDGM